MNRGCGLSLANDTSSLVHDVTGGSRAKINGKSRNPQPNGFFLKRYREKSEQSTRRMCEQSFKHSRVLLWCFLSFCSSNGFLASVDALLKEAKHSTQKVLIPFSQLMQLVHSASYQQCSVCTSTYSQY